MTALRALARIGHYATVLAGTVCAIAIAACGSSTNPPGADATGGPLLREAQCMRAHGVPDFPDPSPAGGLTIPNSIDPNAPAFRSAQHACAHQAQTPNGERASQSRKLEFLALARCMRTHGVASFADPTTSPPTPGDGIVVGGNGWYLALGTAQERRSPVYKRAAAACGVRTL